MITLDLLNQPELTPKEELEKRIERLKEEMEREGLSASIILQNVDIFYFSGTLQRSYLFVPLEGDPVLFVEKNKERAKIESPLHQIEIKGERDVRTYLLGNRSLKGKVGMEHDVVPYAIHERWRRLLDLEETFDISRMIREIRAIKSDFEISNLKRAGSIASKVFEEAKRVIKEGRTEVEVAAELELVGRLNGHQGFLRMRGLNQEMMNIYVLHGISPTIPSFGDVPISGIGLTHAVAQGPSLNRIERGKPTLIDYGGAYNGYITDETRVFVIGDIKDEILIRAFSVACEIVEEIEGFAKEGVVSSHIFEKAYDIVRREGLAENFMGYGQNRVSFVGHGLGLEINELPVITPRHRVHLKEGMVFAFEPKFVFPNLGAIGVEVDYVVRKNGLERIGDFPLDIVRL